MPSTIPDIDESQSVAAVAAAATTTATVVAAAPSMETQEATSLLRAQLLAAGSRTLIELSAHCSAKAAKGNDSTDFASATHVFRNHRLRLTDPQFAALFLPYTTAGRVRLHALVRMLIGPLNERRRTAVIGIFERLDTDHDGMLEPVDVRRAIRIAHHPLVVTGQSTLDQVHNGFIIRSLDPKNEAISLTQFEDYHAALSSAFRRDDEFVSWLQKFWRPT